MLYEILALPTVVDEGLMNIIEDGTLPFRVERVFYIRRVKKDSIRGQHANRNNKEFIIALQGHVKVFVSDGKKDAVIYITEPNSGIYIQENTWVALSEFSEDCILLVFNSAQYDKNDYIFDWEEFVKMKKGV